MKSMLIFFPPENKLSGRQKVLSISFSIRQKEVVACTHERWESKNYSENRYFKNLCTLSANATKIVENFALRWVCIFL